MKVARRMFSRPLHVTISFLFIVLILCVGFVLSYYNYKKTSTIVISATNRLFHEFSLEVAQNFKGTYSPVIQAVSLLSYSHAIRGNTLDERLQSLSLLADVLRYESAVSGLQIGYQNGDYFIVHPLYSDYESSLFAAPDDAAYVVDDISQDDAGGGTLRRVFFNRKLEELGRLAPAPTTYDPRKRPWFIQAMETPAVVSTAPYFFHFLHKVGTTIARQVPGGTAVVAADITLEQISRTLSRTSFAPDEKKVVLRRDGRVLAYSNPGQAQAPDRGREGMLSLADLGSSVLTHTAKNIDLQPGYLRFSFEGRQWLGMVSDLAIGHAITPKLLLLVPEDEILSNVRRVRRNAFILTLITLLVTIPITWFISRKISVSLRQLAEDARRVSRFDFDTPLTIHSRITEVDELADSMRVLQGTVGRFLKLVQSIAGEQDFATTLKRISRETMTISRADAVISYLLNDDKSRLVPDVIIDHSRGSIAPDSLPEIMTKDFVAWHQDPPQPLKLNRDKDPLQAELFALFDKQELNLAPVPLVDRQDDPIGLLILVYHDMESHGDLDDRLSFVRAFSGFAAVSLETRQLIKMQKQLLDSFISLLAGAIDAKSSYTGGHCQRVPVITEMLARAACDSNQGPFKDFSLSVDEWEELHIASWLHDCGKVTTPEYVVDKATKLETIYNRIHEIRTRFEVLKRDAEIACLQAINAGGDRSELEQTLQDKLARLDDDFAFVADCNLGGEFMDPEKKVRLCRIAGYSWMRTLDDRLGLSWEEMQRKKKVDCPELPVEEFVLADKPEHCILRTAADQVAGDNPWNFKLNVPEYLYNLGELYNLQVDRGTLTA
jgi:HAMP domain-containing protein